MGGRLKREDMDIYRYRYRYMGFPGGSVVKNLPINVGDLGWIPGEGNDNPLHYSCLGNPIDRGAWWSTV